MIRRVKGTQDFLDLSLFNFVIKKISQHLILHHFSEVATPIVEQTALFQRSLGSETDVATKEMYTLDTGPDGEAICLRPEATASIVRAFIEGGIQNTPWKIFLWGPMFRHERPQKGRYRQFHQVTMEVIGSNSMVQDAHFIAMLDRLFQRVFQLDSFALHINFLGTKSDRDSFKKVLDKFLQKHISSLCETCKVRKEKNILRIFDCKNEACKAEYKNAPSILDHLSLESQDEWQLLQELLDTASVAYTVVPTLVRGLDYYNKTVFEFVSPNLGAQNAFCGGGRYDRLVSELGGKQDQPSVGAAIGIERLLLLLEPIKGALPLEKEPALHVIIPLSKDQHALAMIMTQRLLDHNLCADMLVEGDSVKSMMRKANKMGASYVLLLGSKEQKNKTVTVKQMVTGKEEIVKQADLIEFLR